VSLNRVFLRNTGFVRQMSRCHNSGWAYRVTTLRPKIRAQHQLRRVVRLSSLHVSRKRLRIPRICETNQLARKAFGRWRTGSDCTYSLSGKMCRYSLNDRPRAIVWLLPCGRSSNLFSHISPDKRILREICRLAKAPGGASSSIRYACPGTGVAPAHQSYEWSQQCA